MQLSTHLNFNGQCEAAFKFYEKVLGGKITFRMTWGEMPGAKEYPPETHKLIMHTSLTVDGQESLFRSVTRIATKANVSLMRSPKTEK